MPKKRKRGRQKGTYGSVDLPLTDKYLRPEKRNRLLFRSLALVLLAALLLCGAFWYGIVDWASSGPLSSSHSSLQGQCRSCHTPFQTVLNGRCRDCHEQSNGAGEYSIEAHIEVAAEDLQPPLEGGSCTDCHAEHRGRAAPPYRDSDPACLSCHSYSPFEDEHPDFEFPAVVESGESAFSHPLHFEVLDFEDPQRECDTCHLATRDGIRFQAIDFAENCQACHEDASWDGSIFEREIRVLAKADFDHRAHRIQLDCFDCHAEIGEEERGEGKRTGPSIERCQQCHRSGQVSTACISCHRFHPDPGRHPTRQEQG